MVYFYRERVGPKQGPRGGVSMADENKNKGGRPRLSDDEAKTIRVAFMATKSFYGQIKKAADKNHLSISSFVSAAVSEKVNSIDLD